jgi:hypothetical protein
MHPLTNDIVQAQLKLNMEDACGWHAAAQLHAVSAKSQLAR